MAEGIVERIRSWFSRPVDLSRGWPPIPKPLPPLPMLPWASMDIAPRDGTVIELENSYGLMPHYGLHRWDDSLPGWLDIRQLPAKVFYSNESNLRWRPYTGDPKDYIDPTSGAQYHDDYYDEAIAKTYGVSTKSLRAMRARNKAEQEEFGDGTNAPTYPKRQWNGHYTLRRGVWVNDFVPRPSDEELDRFRKSSRSAKA